MADDSDLEKRAIEELLRETNRARVRAETMGPAGWMKCPLRSTNKRFLLNTLRSTGLQCRTSGPTGGQATTRGRPRSELQSQDRSRSRTPPRHHRANGGHHKHHRDSSSNDDTTHDRDRDRDEGSRQKDQRHRKDGRNRDSESHRFHCKDLSPGEGHSSSRGHSLSGE